MCTYTRVSISTDIHMCVQNRACADTASTFYEVISHGKSTACEETGFLAWIMLYAQRGRISLSVPVFIINGYFGYHSGAPVCWNFLERTRLWLRCRQGCVLNKQGSPPERKNSVVSRILHQAPPKCSSPPLIMVPAIDRWEGPRRLGMEVSVHSGRYLKKTKPCSFQAFRCSSLAICSISLSYM